MARGFLAGRRFDHSSHEHKDPTNHDVLNPLLLGLTTTTVGLFCLCGLWGSYDHHIGIKSLAKGGLSRVTRTIRATRGYYETIRYYWTLLGLMGRLLNPISALESSCLHPCWRSCAISAEPVSPTRKELSYIYIYIR